MKVEFDLVKLDALVTTVKGAHDDLTVRIADNTAAQTAAADANSKAAATASDQSTAQIAMNAALDALSNYVETLKA